MTAVNQVRSRSCRASSSLGRAERLGQETLLAMLAGFLPTDGEILTGANRSANSARRSAPASAPRVVSRFSRITRALFDRFENVELMLRLNGRLTGRAAPAAGSF